MPPAHSRRRQARTQTHAHVRATPTLIASRLSRLEAGSCPPARPPAWQRALPPVSLLSPNRDLHRNPEHRSSDTGRFVCWRTPHTSATPPQGEATWLSCRLCCAGRSWKGARGDGMLICHWQCQLLSASRVCLCDAVMHMFLHSCRACTHIHANRLTRGVRLRLPETVAADSPCPFPPTCDWRAP
jgi:hypothetical protein